jgi:uncharacterized membrane protein
MAKALKDRLALSRTGLFIGLLFLAASLTPSLIPRPYLMQGALSGLLLALGYGFGILGLWFWRYLELPIPQGRRVRRIGDLACAGALFLVLLSFWNARNWQNSIRTLMDMPPVESVEPMSLVLVTVLVFLIVLFVSRLCLKAFRFLSSRVEPYSTRPISRVLSALAVLILVWTIADGILLKAGLRIADSSFRELDSLIDADVAAPTDPLKSGSAASLVAWQDLGFRGREFVSSGPSAKDIAAFTGKEAKEPIRVYVGLDAADTAEERAALALEEMKRVGAFERSILIVAMPTGTGWMDPAAMDPVEYLHDGDVATVGLQYSYLASWLSLLVEPNYGQESGTALFRAVYGHWTTLPKDQRPRLYLHGLSLGSLNSARSMQLIDVIGDPPQGAFWAGPPFPSAGWISATVNRVKGTPAWLPRFGDSSVIRFTAQKNALDMPGAVWGPMRIVYLQYASDPIVFFKENAFYREPDWMKAPRGPDVSPELRWYPVITALQLGLDIALATTTPMGYGHVYAPENYLDGWAAVTAPAMAPAEIARLREHFIAQRAKYQ